MKPELFSFIDTETTGLDPDKHELIQIAGIVMRIANPSDPSTYELIEEFEYKIKPERIGDANPLSLKINQYDPSKWTEALSLKEAMHLVNAKTKDSVMIAHNVAFDSAFLEKAFKNVGLVNTMHYHRLDTVSMAYALLKNNKDVDHLSLRALCNYFDIHREGEHEALADVRATVELYKKLMSL
jgi:DNA polymerase-3 subunit epsilon